MPVLFSCLYCGRKLRAPESNIGKMLRCPNCGEGLLVPPGPIEQAAAPASPTVPARGAAAPSSPRIPAPAAATTPARTQARPQPSPVIQPPPASGERRRMYLFEAAYVDWGGRIKAVGQAFFSVCVSLWHWFWTGAGATVIEWVLRVGVAISGVLMGVFYVRYELGQGRSFSFGMVFAFCLIAVYVWALMWGWKTPVHVAARGVSATVAAGAVLLLAIATLLLAIGVFSIWLVILVLLTVLLFLISLPLRLGHRLSLLWRGIYHRCPYDDCSFGGEPVHICGCGHQYPDLHPSSYGLLHHTCRHGGNAVKLPTMDLWGRKKLPRLCGGCKRPLYLSSFGELPERPIAVIGGPSAGKTVFLRQATRLLQQRLSRLPESRVEFDSEQHRQELDRDLHQLDRGQVLAKTGGDVQQAFALALRLNQPRKLRSLLYLFDAPGEDFMTMQRFGRKQIIQHLGGIIVLVDPFSLPLLETHAQKHGQNLKASQVPLKTVVEMLINGVNQFLLRQPTERCKVPLAVVIGKADALPAAEHPFLANLCPAPGASADGPLSDRCRQALERLGAGNSIRALEQRFENVHYFACSPLGRMPDPRDTRPFAPAGVVEPFLWMLKVEA